ncbi:MAG: putative 2OG-Fe(II) oxygenase, partial [Pseudomonadota bacterium]
TVPHSGLLELLDPREATTYIQVPNTILDARMFVTNRPGRMVVFPSWVKHMVHPFVGTGVRISIACNVNVYEEIRSAKAQNVDSAASGLR